MKLKVSIRRAGKQDASAILALQRRWQSEKVTWGYRADSKSTLIALLNQIAYVAERDNQVVGFILAKVLTLGGNAVIRRKHRVCEVLDLYVSKRSRRSGIASELLEAVLAESKLQNVKAQYLYSASKDVDSVIQLYRKHGFTSWYVTMYRKTK